MCENERCVEKTCIDCLDASYDVPGADVLIPDTGFDSGHDANAGVDGGGLDAQTWCGDVSSCWRIEDVETAKFFTAFSEQAAGFDGTGRLHVIVGGDFLYHAFLSGAGWVVEVLDDEPGTYFNSRLLFDSKGNMHIFYNLNGTITYKANVNGAWVSTDIVSGWEYNRDVSLAIDSNDVLHICYMNPKGPGLYYATNGTGSWVYELVSPAPTFRPWAPVIAVDSRQGVHIAYDDRGVNSIGLLSKGPSGWVDATIEAYTMYSWGPAIAVDGNDALHVAFSSEIGFRYATNSSGGWVVSAVDDVKADWYIAIAVDSAPSVHLLFNAWNDALGNSGLKYYRLQSGTWSGSDIENPVREGEGIGGLSLVLDAQDHPHAIYKITEGTLNHASDTSGEWQKSVIGTFASLGGGNTLALGSNGEPHLLYFNDSTDALRLAKRNAHGWSISDAIKGLEGFPYPSMVVEADDKVHICYLDDVELKYAYYAGATWKVTNLSGAFGYFSVNNLSMVLDAAGKVHIVGEGRYAVAHVTDATGKWTIETIGNPDSYSGYAALAIDKAGNIHISYGDHDSREVLYAKNASGAWIVEKVTTVNAEFFDGATSIAVDSGGKAHVAISSYNLPLQYATNESGSWTVEEIGDCQSSGSRFIALGSTGDVHIVCSGLMYITGRKGAWGSETISPIAGGEASIAVDNDGHVHISVQDAKLADMKYVTNAP